MKLAITILFIFVAATGCDSVNLDTTSPIEKSSSATKKKRGGNLEDETASLGLGIDIPHVVTQDDVARAFVGPPAAWKVILPQDVDRPVPLEDDVLEQFAEVITLAAYEMCQGVFGQVGDLLFETGTAPCPGGGAIGLDETGVQMNDCCSAAGVCADGLLEHGECVEDWSGQDVDGCDGGCFTSNKWGAGPVCTEQIPSGPVCAGHAWVKRDPSIACNLTGTYPNCVCVPTTP